MNIPRIGKQKGNLFQILIKSYLSVSEAKLSLVLQEAVVSIKQGEKLRSKINKKLNARFCTAQPDNVQVIFISLLFYMLHSLSDYLEPLKGT